LAAADQAILERRYTYLPASSRSPAASEQATLERRLAPARQTLSAEEQAIAWAEGQAMTTHEEAIAYALDGLPPPQGTALSPAGAGEDTARREETMPHPRERQRGATEAPARQRLARMERQAWALEHLRTVGPLSPHDYARALAVSVDTALIDLRALMAQDLVRAEGTTKDRRYILRVDRA
jgi:hypothetical protein